MPLPNQGGLPDGSQNYYTPATRRDVFDGELGRLEREARTPVIQRAQPLGDDLEPQPIARGLGRPAR